MKKPMTNGTIVALIAFVAALFAVLIGWAATYDGWASGMRNLLICCSGVCVLTVIGCVFIAWHAHHHDYEL